jgi:hypothetical protein
MSIEGMWCFVTGEVGNNEIAAGGVIILDTQRIYGGDSAIAHVGNYETANGQVVGKIESFLYNPAYADGEDVFGEAVGDKKLTQFDVALNADGFLVGTISRGPVSLPVILQKLRDLP